MEENLLVKHLANSLLGRLRLKLFRKISGSANLPDDTVIKKFTLDALESNFIIGQMYASILLLQTFSWEYYKNLATHFDDVKLLWSLEQNPLNGVFFVELSECPPPLPKTIGVVIRHNRLADSTGCFYSSYLLGEERFPNAILDYIEVRTCQADPEPVFTHYTKNGYKYWNLGNYQDSRTASITVSVLAYLFDKIRGVENARKDNMITKASDRLPLSEGVYARVLKKKTGNSELAIIIGEDTSAEELRSAWGKIDALRAKLNMLQGTNMHKPEHALLYNYSQMHKHGWSYNTIAMDINYDCLVNLCQAADEVIDVNEHVAASPSFIDAMLLLRAVRVKEEDILEWLLPGLQEIHAGRAPWSPQSGPVDRQKIRDALRQWDQENSTKKVIVKQPPQYDMVATESLEHPISIEYRKKADELLNLTYPNSLEKYKKVLTQTMTKTGFTGAVHISR